MQLTKHFSLLEFLKSETAINLGIENIPTFGDCLRLMQLSLFMEDVRLELNNSPIIITSGFRNFALNKAVGGSSNSDHMRGLACDFISKSNLTPPQCFEKIKKSYLNFDQMILYNSFIHIGLGPQMRRQCLDFRK